VPGADQQRVRRPFDGVPYELAIGSKGRRQRSVRGGVRGTHLFATLSGVAGLLLAASCQSDSEGDAPGLGGSGSSVGGTGSGATGGESGNPGSGASATGGAGGSGAAGGDTANGGSSSDAAGAAGATASVDEQDAGSLDGGDASTSSGPDASAPGVGDGEPCPNGDDCAEGLICVGYGNPLPNGESTACRRICALDNPPPNCTCSGAGFCEESVGEGDGDAGSPPACATADGGCNCGEVIVNPGCADADDTTTDFQSGEFQGCLHWRDLGDGHGWINYETFSGFHYDLQTSLGWVMRADSGSMTLAQAADFCASFSVAGLSDWRLPTIDEARSLAGGCDNTAEGGSCPISDSSCLTSSCGLGTDCTSCMANAGPHVPGNDYCRTDVMLCSVFHTTSSCPDCSAPGDWRYSPLNGNFYSASVEDAFFPACVMENIPRAVPCRN